MNTTTRDIIGHIQTLDYENARLKDELSMLKGRNVDAHKFYAVATSVEVVANLHNVHPDTVRKYVSVGLIDKHPDSMETKILIRASDALMLDFSELKQRYKLRHVNK
jgi:hypothetical protein